MSWIVAGVIVVACFVLGFVVLGWLIKVVGGAAEKRLGK